MFVLIVCFSITMRGDYMKDTAEIAIEKKMNSVINIMLKEILGDLDNEDNEEAEKLRCLAVENALFKFSIGSNLQIEDITGIGVEGINKAKAQTFIDTIAECLATHSHESLMGYMATNLKKKSHHRIFGEFATRLLRRLPMPREEAANIIEIRDIAGVSANVEDKKPASKYRIEPVVTEHSRRCGDTTWGYGEWQYNDT